MKNAESLVAVERERERERERESFTNEKTLVAFLHPKIKTKQSNT